MQKQSSSLDHSRETLHRGITDQYSGPSGKEYWSRRVQEAVGPRFELETSDAPWTIEEAKKAWAETLFEELKDRGWPTTMLDTQYRTHSDAAETAYQVIHYPRAEHSTQTQLVKHYLINLHTSHQILYTSVPHSIPPNQDQALGVLQQFENESANIVYWQRPGVQADSLP